MLNAIDWNAMIMATAETLFMTIISLVFAVVIGLGLGLLLYMSQDRGLRPCRWIHYSLDLLVNILRAIPFIILLCLIIPFTKALVGSILGAKAALPALILSSAPFYARMCVTAFNEVDRGVIEATQAMGASPITIVKKVLIPEAKPALVSSIVLLAIYLIGYSTMAGAIGAGGLGNLAYLYGFVRNNQAVTYIATFIILIIVFTIQWIGDYIVKKIDKR